MREPPPEDDNAASAADEALDFGIEPQRQPLRLHSNAESRCRKHLDSPAQAKRKSREARKRGRHPSGADAADDEGPDQAVLFQLILAREVAVILVETSADLKRRPCDSLLGVGHLCRLPSPAEFDDVQTVVPYPCCYGEAEPWREFQVPRRHVPRSLIGKRNRLRTAIAQQRRDVEAALCRERGGQQQ